MPFPDVGNLIPALQMQRIQNFVWLLQGIALRIVKHLGPFFGVVKGMAHMLLLQGRYRLCGSYAR